MQTQLTLPLPPPARKSLLSHISILCNVHAHGMAPRMRPASLNSSRQRSDQQDTKRAHTGFYGAAGKPFHRITILIITGQTPPVRQDSSDCVYAPEGHTLPQQEKKGCLCSVNIHRGFFYGNVQTRGSCETLLCVINQLFSCLKLHLHKDDSISMKIVTFLKQKPNSASTSSLFLDIHF